MVLGIQVDICKKWFEQSKVECPKTVTAWSNGKSGIDYPPGFSRSTVEKAHGLKVKDIILAILGDPVQIQCTSADLTFLRRSEKETIHFICNSCNTEQNTLLSTIKRWAKDSIKHCSNCRGASGAEKPPKYYQRFLHDDFTPLKLEGSTLTIKHMVCGNLIERDRAYITTTKQRADNLLLQCEFCKPIKKEITGFLSLVEKSVIEGLTTEFPNVQLHREVFYSTIMPTVRNFRADIYLKSLNTVIEITSKNNNLPGYVTRIQEKQTLCEQCGIRFFVVTSYEQAKDIVQSLLRDKEV